MVTIRGLQDRLARFGQKLVKIYKITKVVSMLT